MLSALVFALMDSVNLLLIGVIFALGVMLQFGVYRRVVSLLVFGSWFGFLIAAVLVFLLFDAIGDPIIRLVESALFGILLIATGVVTGILTIRGGGGGEPSALQQRLLGPLKTASPKTVGMGVVLGIAQSLTSVPFLGGLAVLTVQVPSAGMQALGLVLYASVALSLSFLVAVAVGVIRHQPKSFLGRMFTKARENQATVTRAASGLVSVMLIVIGVMNL